MGTPWVVEVGDDAVHDGGVLEPCEEAQSLAPGGGADCVCARALATAWRRIRALGAKAPW